METWTMGCKILEEIPRSHLPSKRMEVLQTQYCGFEIKLVLIACSHCRKTLNFQQQNSHHKQWLAMGHRRFGETVAFY